MEKYFTNNYIDNPLNIKTVNGDIPTTKSSGKNLGILVTVGMGLALTISNVFGFVNSFTGSNTLSLLILVPTYVAIIAKTLSVTIFEEKRQKKAYKDLLDNKVSDLSVIWEVQDINIKTTPSKTEVGVIDYINGTRSVIIKCVYGCVLNREEHLPELHYRAISRMLKSISDSNLTYDIYVRDEESDSDEMFNYYYKRLKDFDDEYFVSIFTEMLDMDRELLAIKSAVTTLYVKVNGSGSNKYKVLKDADSFIEALGNDHAFKEVSFLQDEHNIDVWISKEHSLSLYDREKLVMNKYGEYSDLGLTAVVAGFNEDGEIIKKFNPEYDAKRVIKKRSMNISNSVLNKLKDEEISLENKIVLSESTSLIVEENEGIDISKLEETDNQQIIKLVYSNEKVTIGG